MKKLYIGFFALILLIGTAIIISFAWFTNSEFVEPDLSGYSISAYFGGGDGSEDDPYQIKNQRHLYNLAWLQYLGYFNKPGSGNTPDPSKSTLTQYQFVITQDINMDNWTLPPIGTSLRPFIGLLNGNGHKIYNLKTSNEFIDFGNRHPNNVNSTNFANAEIIGFIGAIGATETMENSSYTFSSEQNAVANIKLSDNTVKTITTSTLVGIAVGYINGTIEDLGIVNSKVDVGSTCSTRIKDDLSSYTVAGYAEDDFVTKTNRTNAVVINPTNTIKTTYVFEDNGDVTGWGGSIAMATMYDHLHDKWTTGYDAGQTYKYYTKATFIHNADGTITENYDESSLKEDREYDSYFVKMYATDTYNGKVIARYTLFHRSDTDRFMYLAGERTKTMSNALTITHQYPGAFYIAQGSNYLTYNSSTSVKNATSQSNASYWYYSNEGRIYTIQNNVIYYLIDDLGTLMLSTSSSTAWTKDSTTIKSDLNNYLVYSNSKWTLKTEPTTTKSGYKIRSGSNYLYYDLDNDVLTNTTDSNLATIWQIDSNNYIFVEDIFEGESFIYYLEGNYGGGAPHIANTISADYTFKKNNSYAWYTYKSGRTTYNFYLIYNNGWTTQTSSKSVTWNSADADTLAELTFYTKTNTTETVDSSYYTGPTYFPLMFNENGDVDKKNTGYVTCGSYYNQSGQNTDIRVSKYYVSNISNSWNNTSKTITNIKTINGSGNTTITNYNNYKKLTDSKLSLEKIIKETLTSSTSSSPLYGLHFMNSVISKDHTIVADYVKINNEEYYDFELPEDSIDFKLKEKGYINFFAGTYFNGNNSFFSLNEIVRNGNNISEIRKISEIYSDGDNSHSYVYKYSDGKYSVPYKYVEIDGEKVKQTLSGGTYTEYSTQNSLASGYSSIFKTSWIEVQSVSTDYVYYFEIPTNDGEYALGSVKGGEGAYLLYLDIGANAQQINRTEIRQKTSVIENFYVFPNGIAIILANTNIDAIIGTDSLDASLSAVTRTNVTGAILVNRTGENEITATTNSNIDSTYIPRTVTLKKNSSEMAAAAVKTTTSIYSQIQYIDYNLTTNAVFETTIQGVTKDNSTTYSFKVYNYTTRELIDTTVERPAWNLYAVVNNKNVIVDLNSASDTNATAIKNTLATIKDSTGTTLLDYNYDTLADSTNTFDIMIKMILDSNDSTGKYYKFSGNDVTITTDDENPSLIYVTIADTTKALKINETTITSVPSQINW